MTNNIGGIILDTFKAVTGHSTKLSEINSWTNSLQYMERVLKDNAAISAPQPNLAFLLKDSKLTGKLPKLQLSYVGDSLKIFILPSKHFLIPIKIGQNSGEAFWNPLEW